MWGEREKVTGGHVPYGHFSPLWAWCLWPPGLSPACCRLWGGLDGGKNPRSRDLQFPQNNGLKGLVPALAFKGRPLDTGTCHHWLLDLHPRPEKWAPSTHQGEAEEKQPASTVLESSKGQANAKPRGAVLPAAPTPSRHSRTRWYRLRCRVCFPSEEGP